jgi:hypothetical protein
MLASQPTRGVCLFSVFFRVRETDKFLATLLGGVASAPLQVVDKKELCPSRAGSLRRGGVTPPQNAGGQGTHNVSRFEKSGAHHVVHGR